MFTSRLKRVLQLLLVMSFSLSLNIAFADASEAEDDGLGNSKAGQEGAKCVRSGEQMRRIHMDLILHQRDKTVRKGMRDTTDSLKECIACHVKYDEKHDPIPVNAEGQFCSHCHEKVATNLDCFECHSTVPRDKTSALSLEALEHIVYDSAVKKTNADLVKMISSLEKKESE